VGFVKDHCAVIGEDLPPLLVAQREVGEEERMVDDDDVRFERSLAGFRDEARVEARSFLADADV
jgi:hypothetical protein